MDTPPQPQPGGHLLGRFALILLYLGILALVSGVFIHDRGGFGFFQHLGTTQQATRKLFPLVGLFAFTFVWTQIILGATMPLMRRLFPSILHYHRLEGIFALLFAFIHPSLLLIGVGLPSYLQRNFVNPDLSGYIFFGYAGLLCLILTVVTALLARRPWFARHWRAIHYLNYATFAIIWVHSWMLGTDVRGTPLQWLWLGFGVTAVAAFSWRRWQRAVARRAARMALPTQPQA